MKRFTLSVAVAALAAGCARPPTQPAGAASCPPVLQEFGCVGPVVFTFEGALYAIPYGEYRDYASRQFTKPYFIALPDGRVLKFDGLFEHTSPLGMPHDTQVYVRTPPGLSTIVAQEWDHGSYRQAREWLAEQGRIR